MQELGADYLINYKEEDFAQVVKEHTTAKNLPVSLWSSGCSAPSYPMHESWQVSHFSFRKYSAQVISTGTQCAIEGSVALFMILTPF